jgi:putative two-component system response regulator
LFGNSCWQGALDVVSQLDELTQSSSNAYWQRKATMFAAIMHSELGNTAEAVVRHSHALHIAQEAGEALGQASVLGNLGAALNYGGLYREALRCLEAGAAIASSEQCLKEEKMAGITARTSECAALTNLAQSLYYLGELDKGMLVIRQCLARSPQPTNVVLVAARVVREFTLVLFALDLGMIDDARLHTEQCRNFAAGSDRRSRLIAKVCSGLCEVYSGDVARGLAELERCLEEAGEIGTTRVTVLRALAKAATQINQPTKALEYTERVLAEITKAREAGVKALLSINRDVFNGRIVSESDDLGGLKLARANLKAKVAEQDAFNARLETLERLAITADVREEASGGHGYRVGRLASLVAKEMGWSKDSCHSIELAGRLHDIGKIAMPDRVMLKPGDLQTAERKFVESHTRLGAEFLTDSSGQPMRMAQDVAYFHHEHWDGTGYPTRRKGERIPVHARIVAVVDAYDALTHGRPYQAARPSAQALEEIEAQSGKQFDPEIVPIFTALIRRLIAKHGDLDRHLGQSGQSSVFSEARTRIQELLSEARVA